MDPKKSTFLGSLSMNALYKSLQGRLFGVKVDPTCSTFDSMTYLLVVRLL